MRIFILKTVKKSALLAALFIGFIPISANAQSNDISSAISNLIEINPQLSASSNNINAANSRIDGARGAFLPEVSLSGRTGYSDIYENFEGTGSAAEDIDGNSTMLTATARLNLFSGFSDTANLENSRLTGEIAQTDSADMRQRVIFEGISTYTQLTMARDLLALSRAEQRNARAEISTEQDRVSHGGGIAMDVLVAEQRLQQIEANLLDVESIYNEALINYSNLFQTAPMIDTMETPIIPVAYLPSSIEELRSLALNNHPETQRANLETERQATQIDAASAGYYPSLDLVGETIYENDFDGSTGKRRDATISLRANWEIFSGFQTQNAVRAAAFEHAASLDNARYAAQYVTREADLSWNRWEMSNQRTELAAENLRFAEELLSQRQELLEGGRETRRGILDAETRIFAANIDLIQAQYDMILAAYQIIYSTGKLDLDTIPSL